MIFRLTSLVDWVELAVKFCRVVSRRKGLPDFVLNGEGAEVRFEIKDEVSRTAVGCNEK